MSPSPWEWVTTDRYPAFTLTLTCGMSPHQILAAYGADPMATQLLTEAQAHQTYPLDDERVTLRAGDTGSWGFCFENSTTLGATDSTLACLCEDTDSLMFYKGGDGTNLLAHWRNGSVFDQFEPTDPPTFGRSSSPLLVLVHRYLHTHHAPLLAGPLAITDYTRVAITVDALQGMLHTSII